MNAAFTVLVVLIIIAAILLIAVVLLQNGKDGGLATNFTSANQTVFVGRGNTRSGSNEAISTEILNQAEQAPEEAPAFPISQENPEVAE